MGRLIGKQFPIQADLRSTPNGYSAGFILWAIAEQALSNMLS